MRDPPYHHARFVCLPDCPIKTTIKLSGLKNALSVNDQSHHMVVDAKSGYSQKGLAYIPPERGPIRAGASR